MRGAKYSGCAPNSFKVVGCNVIDDGIGILLESLIVFWKRRYLNIDRGETLDKNVLHPQSHEGKKKKEKNVT